MRGVWILDSEPGSPPANMTADEALFDAVRLGQCHQPIVRVYTWDRPSVSFGRLQSEDAVREAFPNLPLVRRPTGGLAVLHGSDLTVSVITRQAWMPDANQRGVMSSYRQIVGGLLDAFSAIGINGAFGDSEGIRPNGTVDCFAFAAGCDAIEANTGHKLMGCAQRRQDGTLLQQMSIPFTHLREPSLFLRHAHVGLGRALGVGEWAADDKHLSQSIHGFLHSDYPLAAQ